MKNFLGKTKVTMKLCRYFQPFRIIVLIFDGEVKYIHEFREDFALLIMNVLRSKYPTCLDFGSVFNRVASFRSEP